MGIGRRLRRISDSVLDKSVVFDFDRTGFERHAREFSETELENNLSEQWVAITGCTSGLGLAAARALSERRANLLLLCRDTSKAARLAEDFKYPSQVRIERIDVADFDSIDALAERVNGLKINTLIHNAGVLLSEHQLSNDGLERTLATNLIGPFRLTYHLLTRFAQRPRIVFVSSGGMYTQKLDLEVLERGPVPFDGAVAYAQTKRAQVMIADAFAARLGDAASVVSMHPGWADTPGVEASLPRFYRATKKILRSPEQGADTMVWLAARKFMPTTGEFYFDRAIATRHMSSRTHSPELVTPLWKNACRWSEVGEEAMEEACASLRAASPSPSG